MIIEGGTMELECLKTLVIIFVVSAFVIFLLQKWKVPSIVGFLIAGAALGPHGFGMIREVREVELLAEVGVILLLFMIGLEISLKNLKRIRSTIVGGGFSQVLLTLLATAAMAYPFLGKWNASLFTGFLVALSSTAIVMKMLFDRAEMDSPHGRLSMGILIFRTRSRELFVITIILLCLGTALLTSEIGLSLALGAFLAGLIISESEYAYQAISDILPFKDSFNGLS